MPTIANVSPSDFSSAKNGDASIHRFQTEIPRFAHGRVTLGSCVVPSDVHLQRPSGELYSQWLSHVRMAYLPYSRDSTS